MHLWKTEQLTRCSPNVLLTARSSFPAAEQRLEASQEPQTGHNQPVRSRRRILLVDDDEKIRYLMRTFLQSAGYDVFSCACGGDAVDALAGAVEFDLLLTDFEMPGLSGMELAAVAGRLDPAMPVMIVSGAMLSAEVLARMDGAGWRFMAKPFAVPPFLEMVARLMKKNR